ncbi:YraN family protein [Christensenellaceae bacterium OttesenSCG-928-K19]|nr:YraN family protein [Christensenellaceae bacterium OttesenSCG-928-K19]
MLGRRGEEFTCSYAVQAGMKVLCNNFHCRAGEIDIIARDGETIVFVEVKTRSNKSYGSAAEAVTPAKIRKIKAAALEYITQNNLHDSNFRFDVAEVYSGSDGMSINYIRSAFE